MQVETTMFTKGGCPKQRERGRRQRQSVGLFRLCDFDLQGKGDPENTNYLATIAIYKERVEKD